MREPFVVLKEVYLRALERADLPSLVKWINDAEVTRLLFMGDRPATVERLTEQWETEQRGGKDIPFAVCARKGDALLGTTGLYSIQWIMRTAEFRIFLGDKRYWNRGSARR
ncbi:MAG: GNAT family N-acetyltransferase [Elusimicrobia bacterium]|nr:GNAT family N-acetyltransferase [Elusimicrobiota bacterium]